MRSIKFGKVLFTLGAVTMLLTYFAADANAGWRHWGSRGYGSSGGSSGGSWGSSGGSSGGSWGSSGGSHGRAHHMGPIRRMIAHKRARHHGSSGGSWGSSGGSRGYASYGSSGGSSGGYRYYSASSGGSRGYYGSSGGSSGGYRTGVVYSGTPVYNSPAYGTPVMTSPAYGSPVYNGGIPVDSYPSDSLPSSGQPSPTTDPPSPGPTRTGTEADPGTDGDTAILNLRLPVEAVVYVNGKRTQTEGTFRSYVSRNLKPGKRYTYEVRAEMDQDGTKLARTKVVQLTAGTNKTFDIEFDAGDQLVTSVTLLVPDNAVVKMGGVDTRATGNMRYFSTSTLKEGEKWENYTVSVAIERDGEEVVQEKVVNVNAGDSLSLQFDFDQDEQVASR